MRFAVVQFGGSNCDRDVHHVVSDVCGVDCDLVWYKDGITRDYDAIVIPGGFSYGDYLRAGAIAARTPVMEAIKQHAEAGKLVLGICNGAQIGAETALVPGTFTTNATPKFICRPVCLRVETEDTPFTREYRTGEVIRIPIAHKEGRYVAPAETLRTLNAEKRVAFRFCDEQGNVTPAANPNGAAENITGVIGGNERNVLCMMPHPERASEEVLGSDDGRRIFTGMIRSIEDRENGKGQA
ncbi:phosphoribosylformylglycinamidine synthase I [Methanofollis fontis]|uniref:Phosphoribosylformylglycinamidine synthase subunit PurQ n=1 Tax=Methanofollis fontis TaxID=2052832 RepID=A0A483CQQ6_9EURY|nr:phosphoribosylformylglycinamidine synthase I [Methanofollis fontis]TAJ43535.1 phosphoribosylformylglycinamidine synthase I [Methanofollis fontis]